MYRGIQKFKIQESFLSYFLQVWLIGSEHRKWSIWRHGVCVLAHFLTLMVMSLPDDASGTLCKPESLWGIPAMKQQVVSLWSWVWGRWQLVRRAQVQRKERSRRFPTGYLKGLDISHMSPLEYLGTLIRLRYCSFTWEQKGRRSVSSTAWAVQSMAARRYSCMQVPRHTHQTSGSHWTPLHSCRLPWAHGVKWGEWKNLQWRNFTRMEFIPEGSAVLLVCLISHS